MIEKYIIDMSAGIKLVVSNSQLIAETLCLEKSKNDNNIIGANFLFNFIRSRLNIIREKHLKKINQKDVADII